MPAAEASSRRDPRWLLVIAALLLGARVGVGLYEGHRPAGEEFVHWQPITGARALADRPLLYDFSAEWCGPCQSMQREVFSDPRQAAVIDQAFVPVRVVDRQRENGQNPPEVAALQARYAIRAFPTLVVVGPDGRSQAVTGYAGAAPLMAELMTARRHVLGPAPDRPGVPSRSP